jgi:hypothetical protein
MRDLQLRDLLDLVSSDVSDPEDRVFQMYAWHFEHTMTAVKIVLGAAGSLFVAVLIAFFKKDIKVPWWESAVAFVATFLATAYGVYLFLRLRSIHKQYVATLRLLSNVKALSPFIKLYQASGER